MHLPCISPISPVYLAYISRQVLPANEPERTWPPPGMDDPEEQAAWWVAQVTARKQPEGTSFQACFNKTPLRPQPQP